MKFFTDEGCFLVTAQLPVQYGASIFSLGIFNTEKRALDFINNFIIEQQNIIKQEKSKIGYSSTILYKDLKITKSPINPSIDSKKIKAKSCGNLLLKIR